MANLFLSLGAIRLLVGLAGSDANTRFLVDFLDVTTGQHVSQYDLWDIAMRGSVPLYTSAERKSFRGYSQGRNWINHKIAQFHADDASEVSDMYVTPYFRGEELPLAALSSLRTVVLGSGEYLDVINYQHFAKVDDLDTDLPLSLQVDDGEILIETWQDWLDASPANWDLVPVGDYYYIPLTFAGSFLLQLASEGVTLVDTAPVPTPTPEEV